FHDNGLVPPHMSALMSLKAFLQQFRGKSDDWAIDVLDVWESSRKQPGEAGIITNYLGIKPGINDAKSALDAFRTDLPKMSPKMADSLDPNAVTPWFWTTYPYTLGSYSNAKVGQYTTMLEVASEPALHGRLQFAGEHTNSDFLGFMNGGVQSGNRASAAL